MKKIAYFFIALTFIGCSKTEKKVSVFSNPAPSHSQYPYLYSNGSELYMSWIKSNESGEHTLKYAVYANGTWSEVRLIAEGKSWFINWADFPSIIADDSGPVAAHWLDKIPGGTYAYNVNISLMNQSGEWTSPLIPHSDGTATEHGFVSMVSWNENTILAVWLDGRQSAHDAPKEYYNIANAMTLRAALITASGEIKKTFLIDNSVCDCCQTSLIKTARGALVAYRNRTENEIRDIYVSRFDGTKWSKPEAVYHDNWKISACPVNGPKLASNDSFTVVTWPTAGDKQLTVKAALTFNDGGAFNDPVIVSRNTLGRVDAAIYDNKIYISWIEKTKKGASIKLKRLGVKESTPKTVTVAQVNASRRVGFPQLEVLGDNLIMAWTSADSTSTRIKTVKVDILR